ncbi:MAG: hypothetical protein PF574_09530 [Candidatus Delongbacteria bacterium]|jgi:septal ring factor EnvC (AmiA/AmiB activator)|nr:hypothetical protein [Candidatus Delongbacteria bacterium]
MKLRKVALSFLSLVLFVSILSCSKGQSSLDSQLNNLEKIIEKYESRFEGSKSGTQEYTDIINEYNKEIGDWGSVFEKDRYEKDENGKKIEKQGFKDVKKRFIDLNSRMTRMILATISKKDPPANEISNENNQ